MIEKPDEAAILGGLKDFQRRTVDYVFQQLYLENTTDRFLIADEVGLGKTLVAKGVLAKTINYLWDKAKRINVLYICSNADIAHQNIDKLNITGDPELEHTSRITLLPLQIKGLKNEKLNFISFTPGTSFNLRSQSGIALERVLIYHMLKEGWGFGERSGAKNLFQCGKTKDNWRNDLRRFEPGRIDQDIKHSFLQALEEKPEIRRRFDDLVERFGHYRKAFALEDRRERDRLIGDLRGILAEECIKKLKPDLVILDEFQRFKTLLDGEDEMATLARRLFNYPGVKILLLSATPYKMYTMYHESDEDGHYQDFIRTVGFLFNAKEKVTVFEEKLKKYRRELYNLTPGNTERLNQTKLEIEASLKKVMVRTERLAVTENRDGMVVESRNDLGWLTPQELKSFAVLDQVATLLEVGDTVEYWKSAPYLLNIMDKTGYQLKEKLIQTVDGGEIRDKLRDILAAGADCLLSAGQIEAYQRIDPANAKLRTLLENTVDNGAWQLLWIAPSIPYYQVPEGPYSSPALQRFTKALVFSAWRVVPKVIAMLCSYEAERLAVKAGSKYGDYSSRRHVTLLRFGSVDGRPVGMSNFNLIYPCWTLATTIDPLRIMKEHRTAGNSPDLDTVTGLVKAEVGKLMEPILNKFAGPGGAFADERWYWAALALLDRHYHRKEVEEWLQGKDDEFGWGSFLETDLHQEDDHYYNNSITEFREYFTNPEVLGRPPADLLDVLTKVALASPAVTALRLFLRFSSPKEFKNGPKLLSFAAAKVGMGFRSLFNSPDAIALVRSLRLTDDTRYWESVLDYCLSGNLQAVLDEYLHVLQDTQGLAYKPADYRIIEMAEKIVEAATLRTASLEFDEIDVEKEEMLDPKDPKRIRCHYALRFGDGKDDEEGQGNRAEQVRAAFNSPFRPFILATTSVGQEGLDFHLYCHEIYHWNLPSNPVDLEQREGRIHRYKGHAIRRNVALAFGPFLAEAGESKDPWENLFNLAEASRLSGQNDLIPYWIYEIADGYIIVRHVPALPLSRELGKLENLKRSLAAYRMVIGQPRQEDLLKYLEARLATDLHLQELERLRINLEPGS